MAKKEVANIVKLTSDEFSLFMLGWHSCKAHANGLDEIDSDDMDSSDLLEKWFDSFGRVMEEE